MKHQLHKQKVRGLRVASETIRTLEQTQLADVAGGAGSNNGCGGSTSGSNFSRCTICAF